MTPKWGTPSSAQQLEESSMYPKSSWDESWFPAFNSRGMPIIHKHLKRKLLSATGMWEGPWVCCLKWNGHWDALTRKKAAFPCSGLNAGSSFISQDEGMFESPVETLEKALGPRLIWTGGLTSLWHLERKAEFNASKGDDARLLLKIDRNPNIPGATGKGTWVSRLTSRCVPIALPSLVEIPEVSPVTRQESWRRWTNTSLKWSCSPRRAGRPPPPHVPSASLRSLPQIPSHLRLDHGASLKLGTQSSRKDVALPPASSSKAEFPDVS